MAFKLIKPEEQCWLAPYSCDGLYLLPYSWLVIGFRKQFLEIEDKLFYDSLQGSLFLQLQDEDVKIGGHIDDYKMDIWYVYDPIEKIAFPIYKNQENVIHDIHSNYLKQDVKFVNSLDLCRMSPSMQKTVNNSIIQLMKGCHVKLKCSVWF